MELFQEKMFNVRGSLTCVISKANQPAFILRLSSLNEIEALEKKLSEVKEFFKVESGFNNALKKIEKAKELAIANS